METDKFKIEMLDYYYDSNEVLYRINIYNKKSNESWDIERSYDDFKQVDHLFQYRYPQIPRLPSKGWWWQKNKTFHENRFQSLKKYFNSVLESDSNIENMVLMYFLDLNLVLAETGNGGNNSVEEIDIDILDYLKTKLLNISNASERSLAPMEQKAREKQYHSLLENNQCFSEYYNHLNLVKNPYFTKNLDDQKHKKFPPSVLDTRDNTCKHAINTLVEEVPIEDKETISMMNRMCMELSKSYESKMKTFDVRNLKLYFQPIK